MKTIVFIAALLSGCATNTFENRAACTLDRQEAFVLSMYGPLGVASRLAAADAKALCAAVKDGQP